MDEYVHHVSGFFVHRNDADKAYRELLARGLPQEQLKLLAADSLDTDKPPEAESRGVLKDVLVDGAIGTAIGTGLGAVGQLALVAANVSLFVASPLLAPLAMLGWGAALGGIVGAAAGAEKADGKLSELVHDAVASGQSVLVVETRSQQETDVAREVIQAAVGEYKDKAAS